jgi:hypothetical protein
VKGDGEKSISNQSNSHGDGGGEGHATSHESNRISSNSSGRVFRDSTDPAAVSSGSNSSSRLFHGSMAARNGLPYLDSGSRPQVLGSREARAGGVQGAPFLPLSSGVAASFGVRDATVDAQIGSGGASAQARLVSRPLQLQLEQVSKFARVCVCLCVRACESFKSVPYCSWKRVLCVGGEHLMQELLYTWGNFSSIVQPCWLLGRVRVQV